MIKNSLIYNNRNSHINTIGWELILKMKDEPWFKDNVLKDLNFKEMENHQNYNFVKGVISDIEKSIKGFEN